MSVHYTVDLIQNIAKLLKKSAYFTLSEEKNLDENEFVLPIFMNLKDFPS